MGISFELTADSHKLFCQRISHEEFIWLVEIREINDLNENDER
jgi:hypothetical protein